MACARPSYHPSLLRQSLSSVLQILTLDVLFIVEPLRRETMPLAPLVINNNNVVVDQSRSEALKERVLPSLFVALLGLMLIYGAGFSTTVQVHNAAHDGRHSASFPCH